MNDPLYNHVVFGPTKGKGGIVGKTDDELIQDLIAIHNAENWLGMDGDVELSMFNKADGGKKSSSENSNDKVNGGSDKDSTSSGSPNSSKGSSSGTNTGEEDSYERQKRCCTMHMFPFFPEPISWRTAIIVPYFGLFFCSQRTPP